MDEAATSGEEKDNKRLVSPECISSDRATAIINDNKNTQLIDRKLMFPKNNIVSDRYPIDLKSVIHHSARAPVRQSII